MNHIYSIVKSVRKYEQWTFIIGIIAFIVTSLPSCAPHKAVPAVDPLDNFSILVEKDTGLSAGEKKQWVSLTRKTFTGKSFNFDYSRLVYDILSQAKFDEVDLEKAVQVAFSSVKAVDRKAPEDEVSDLALFAFSVRLSVDEIRLYAVTAKKCKTAGVPVHVTQEMIRHAKEDTWTEHTFTTIMEGLMKAASQNLDTEKVGLFMLISVAQKLGTPEKVVQDALADAKKRASSLSEKKKAQSIKKPVFSESTGTSRGALNYDTLQRSVESFIGTPYVWGGNTRRGVDCSGFTRLVMYENGYQIPRVSRDQARAGTPVYKNNMQLGDLVFFDTKGRGQITHVGLYLGGNLLVHASSSKGVTLVLFSNRYFQSRYVTSRRIVRYSVQ
jgi:cell wall-associated NlpC family hydrolase